LDLEYLRAGGFMLAFLFCLFLDLWSFGFSLGCLAGAPPLYLFGLLFFHLFVAGLFGFFVLLWVLVSWTSLGLALGSLVGFFDVDLLFPRPFHLWLSAALLIALLPSHLPPSILFLAPFLAWAVWPVALVVPPLGDW
jgi:hypothetical protein